MTDTGTTHFHYDRQDHLIAETDNSGATIREYLWLGDMPIGLVATQTGGSGPELFAVHTDHLATTLRITDNLQQTAWKSTREPFGESTLATTNTVIWPLRFPGQYEDNETGFVYNYFRDYDPQIGRYIESDPVGLDDGVNTYAYVYGDPLNLADPEGLSAEHTQNQRESNRNKHEEGQARKAQDRGGEKGDGKRDYPRKKPDKWKGPWPPRMPAMPLWICPLCPYVIPQYSCPAEGEMT